MHHKLNPLCFKKLIWDSCISLSSEADLGRLKAVDYYHKSLHLGCCSIPRSSSEAEWIFLLVQVFGHPYCWSGFKTVVGLKHWA